MMKRVLFIYIILLITISVEGQDITVRAEYPEVVTAGQQFNISWNVNSGGGEFSAPAFNGFYKLMGPQTSYSSSTQIINGKMTRQTSYTYVYYLQSISAGKYVIPPTSPTGDSVNENYNSESARGDVFVNLTLNRKDIYLGEHVVATVKIFTKVNLSGINEIKFPSFDGFLKSDIATPPLTSLRQENVNGTIYGTGLVQQFLLYPQITGEINIDPVQISVLIQQKSNQSDPFFGDFFTSYQTAPKAVVSQAVRINVKPLPGVQPDDFSGVVGKLNLSTEMSQDSVDVNDAINFKITISGSGNLKVAGAPVLKLSPDIEVYDPKVSDDVKNGVNGTTGQKSFEYLLIPRHYGDFTIPSITYSYFNTSLGRYEKLTSKELQFYARKGSEQNAGITVYGGVSKEDVKYLGKDIRFIKSISGTLKRSGNIIISNRAFYSAYASALFIFLVILFIRREHVRRNADLSLVKNRKARKVAVKRLRSAATCLKNDNIDKFYDEILKSIWGYLSDKLNIPVSDLSRNRAATSLAERGVDEERLKSLTEILDTCEYARYAPSSSGTEAASIYESASQFIQTIENSIS